MHCLLLWLLLGGLLLKLKPLLVFPQLHVQNSPENFWRKCCIPAAVH